MLSEDLAQRSSAIVWFEGTALDLDGRQVKMHSVVTPVDAVLQHFDEGQPSIELRPGDRLIVLGASDGDTANLWLEIDQAGHPWANAMVTLPANRLRYLCEVGDDLHMKARH